MAGLHPANMGYIPRPVALGWAAAIADWAVAIAGCVAAIADMADNPNCLAGPDPVADEQMVLGVQPFGVRPAEASHIAGQLWERPVVKFLAAGAGSIPIWSVGA